MANKKKISKKKKAIQTKVQVGKRYVFFSDLTSEKNRQEAPSLYALGQHAQKTLQKIDHQLTGTEIDDDKINDKFSFNVPAYLFLIRTKAEIMSKNETQFVAQQIEQLQKAEDFIESPRITELQELSYELINGTDGKFNYNKFIALLNALLLDPKDRDELIKQQINNIEILNKNYTNLSDEEKKQAENSYKESYEKYRTNFASKLKAQLSDNKKSIPTFTNVVADKINSIIQRLATNPILLKQLSQNLKKNSKIKITQLKQAIIAIITQEVLNNSTENIDKIIEKIAKETETDVLTTIKEFIDQNSFSTFNSKTQKSIEELAMRQQNKFNGLADAVLNLTSDEQEKLFEKYDPEGKYKLKILFKELNDVIENSKKDLEQSNQLNIIYNKKANFTRLIGQIIQQTLTGTKDTLTNNEFNNIKNEIKAQADKCYIERKLRQELKTQLSITRIQHSGIAEQMATKEIQQQLINIAFNQTPGTTINLKDDITFFVGFTPIKQNVDIDMSKINRNIAKIYKNYLPEYKELSKGATDIQASQKKFTKVIKATLKEIIKQLKIADKDSDKLKKILENFYNAFFGSVSVKDYDLYNNELGFHGGSLGGGKKIDAVIENIFNMYNAGGISNLDADMLIFATINCTDSTYGTDAMKQHIANFLLGGAALMMFDEDFLDIQNFLNKTEQELFNNSGLKSVQLYRVNNIYIPASYILFTIYDQLSDVYADITENFLKAPKTNQVNITTHNLTIDDIPTNNQLSTKERWETISSLAIENTKVEFLFMAGLLDILENLKNAFKIPT